MNPYCTTYRLHGDRLRQRTIFLLSLPVNVISEGSDGEEEKQKNEGCQIVLLGSIESDVNRVRPEEGVLYLVRNFT